jgi:hypothetical protein
MLSTNIQKYNPSHGVAYGTTDASQRAGQAFFVVVAIYSHLIFCRKHECPHVCEHAPRPTPAIKAPGIGDPRQ